MIPAPDPGIYRGVPMEIYQSWDAASASRLSDVKHAPAVAWYRMTAPPSEPTAAMAYGTACHAAILEPDLFRQTYVRRPPGHPNSTAYKAARDALEADGLVLLTDDQMDGCLAAQKAALGHCLLGGLLRVKGLDRELSVVADLVTLSGIPVRCKVRPDLIDSVSRIIVDVKTTTNARADAMARTIWDLAYHRSAALYLDVCRAAGIDVDCYLYFAIEKDPPFLTCLYQLEGPALEVGRQEVSVLLDAYGRCQTRGEWPGLAGGVVPLGLPGWAYNRIFGGE